MLEHSNDWEKVRLGDVGYVQMCRRIFQHQTKDVGDIPFFKIGTFGQAPDAFISRELFEDYKSRYPFPRKGDVLLSAAGTIGRALVFDGSDSYYQDSNIVWLKTDDSVIDSTYLWWVYRSYPWRCLEGTTISRLYNYIILNTVIYLPSLKEQKAIAKTLTAFDEIISSLNGLILKNQNIRHGALENLVTGAIRLKETKCKWRKASFDELVAPKARIGWQGLKTEEYLRQGYSYLISGSNFVDGHIDIDNLWYVSKDRYDMDLNIQVNSGDVLVSKDGTIGKVAIVQPIDRPATLNSGVFVFKTKEGLNSYYLYRLLQSSVFTNFIQVLSAGSTIKHLYQKDLKHFEFTVPEDIEEQQEIASTIQSIDDEIESLKSERDKWIQIREAAMNDLLTGRIRLNLGDEACQA